MQDGEYTVRGKTEAIRRAVFVFAGGTAGSFMQFLPASDEEAESFRAVKGPDFVSRLKGVLNIKGLNPSSERDRSHIIRRAMLLREQIIRRVPGIYNEEGKLINISKGLLSALLRVSEYRHGARSLEFILAMCRLSDVNRFTPSCLPMDEQLDIHLDVKDFRNKLAFEQVMGESVDLYARIAHENYRKQKISQWKAEADLNEIEGAIPLSEAGEPASILEIPKGLISDPEMADWESLDESFKENSRSQIRYLGEQLVSYESEMGLRPKVPGARDAIDDLYGPALEQIAAMEHERWIQDRRRNGWTLGKDDPELLQSSEMVPYEELEEKSKDYIRKAVRQIPQQLREMGFELYHKSY